MTWITNAFSASMLRRDCAARVAFLPIDAERASQIAVGAESAVGHTNTAGLFSRVLGRPIAQARRAVTLEPGDRVLIGQYTGPRLPEGATALPAGAEVHWWLAELALEAT